MLPKASEIPLHPGLGNSKDIQNKPGSIPSPIPPGCAINLTERLWGAPCSPAHAVPKAARKELAWGGGNPPNPAPLYESCSEIVIPKEFNPGNATGLLPKRPEHGLCAQPALHTYREGGECLQVRQAPQEGQDSRCFPTEDVEKQQSEAETPVVPSGRCKTRLFP